MKKYTYLLLSFGGILLQPSFVFSQFTGGSSDEHAFVSKADIVKCSSLPSFSNINTGGSSDGHAFVSKADIVKCSSLPSFANINTGGSSDGHAFVSKANIVKCSSLPSFSNISIGGSSDGHAFVSKTNIMKCSSLPSFSNISTGGSSDGHAFVSKADIVKCSSLPSFSNISTGGSSDGHAFIGPSYCSFINICSVVARAGNDTAICYGNSLQLTATGGVSYTWSTGDTTASIHVMPLNTMTFTVSVSNDTCANSDSLTVTVDTLPKAAIAGTTKLCKGDTTVLTASGGNTFLWNTGDTTTSINIETKNFVSLPKDTTYKVKVINGTCSDSSSVTIKVNPFPMAVIAGISKLCKGQNTTLIAKGGKTYLWSTGDTTATLSVNPANDTAYTVTVSDGLCKDTALFTVTVNAGTPPVATITGNKTVCAGNSTVLTASGGDTYLWNTKEATKTITAAPNTDTTYIVIVSNSSCSDSESVKIKVNALPTVKAGQDVTITSGSNATLSVVRTQNFVSLQWNPTAGLSNDTIMNPVANPTTTTTYIVKGTDANGCTNSDTIIVIVMEKDSCGEMFIPTAFSPNDNTFNDVFRVRMPSNCLKEIHFVVYDRWGKKVFETDDITKGWDGTFDGKALNTAVFVYYLKATLTDGNEVEQRGNVSLIR